MLTLIFAHDEAGGIGFKDGLPWPRIKEDMKRFRQATTGNIVLMGRKTFDSLGKKPLPNRRNIVFSRSGISIYYEDTSPGMNIVSSTGQFEDFLPTLFSNDKEQFIIGGAQIYDQALPYATRILLTRVIGTFEADTFWKPDLTGWDLVSKEEGVEDDKVVCIFEEYTREVPEKLL